MYTMLLTASSPRAPRAIAGIFMDTSATVSPPLLILLALHRVE